MADGYLTCYVEANERSILVAGSSCLFIMYNKLSLTTVDSVSKSQRRCQEADNISSQRAYPLTRQFWSLGYR